MQSSKKSYNGIIVIEKWLNKQRLHLKFAMNTPHIIWIYILVFWTASKTWQNQIVPIWFKILWHMVPNTYQTAAQLRYAASKYPLHKWFLLHTREPS